MFVCICGMRTISEGVFLTDRSQTYGLQSPIPNDAMMRTKNTQAFPALLVAYSKPCGTPIRKQPAGLSQRIRRTSMKQDARKNWHRRKRQKRRLAMRKYMAEKKSKGVAAAC